jgi:hypothetical protein
MAEHNLETILETLKWAGVLKKNNKGILMSEQPKIEPPKPAPLAAPEPKPQSQTEFVDSKKEQAKYIPSLLDVVWDFLGLEKAMEVKFENKSSELKKSYFKFFIFGVIFAYIGIFFTLTGIGITLTWQQYLWTIFSFLVSMGFAFVWGKFKESIPLILNDQEKLKEMLTIIVKKLSPPT